MGKSNPLQLIPKEHQHCPCQDEDHGQDKNVQPVDILDLKISQYELVDMNDNHGKPWYPRISLNHCNGGLIMEWMRAKFPYVSLS